MLAVSGLRTINPACELGLGQTRGHDEMTSHDTDDMSIPSHEFPHDPSLGNSVWADFTTLSAMVSSADFTFTPVKPQFKGGIFHVFSLS